MQIPGTSRKVLLIILGVLTLAFLIVAVLIALRLQQSQAPTGASAGCSHYNGTNSMTICGGNQEITVTIQTCNCPNATGGAYPACICNENCTSRSETIPAGESRTYTASASCGTQQIDVGGSDLFGSGVCAGAGSACGSSSSSSSSGRRPICGEACSQTSDCTPPTGAGTAICRNGICENASCPAGQTIPGTICGCSAGRTCGQTCGSSVGLCQDGVSTCSFISGNSCTGNEDTNSTACVPNPIYTNAANAPAGWTSQLCDSNPNGNKLTKYQGRAPTLAEVQQACLIVNAVCGDGKVDTVTGEQCDPTANPPGCAAGLSCGSDCKCTANPVCGSNCTSNTECPTGHACTAGKCVLNGCTGTTCTNGCIPLCGGPCDPALANQCPVNHTCNSTTRTCMITACSANPSICTDNGCTPPPGIPGTALISDEVDRFLIGGLLLILGVMAVKFKWIESVEDLLVNLNGSSWDPRAETRVVRKSRNKYEKGFEKK